MPGHVAASNRKHERRVEMRRLDEQLADLATSGTVEGPERAIERLRRRLADDGVEIGSTFRQHSRRSDMRDSRRWNPRFVAAAVIATAVVVGVPALLLSDRGSAEGESAASIPTATIGLPTTTTPAPGSTAAPFVHPIEWERVPLTDDAFGHALVRSVIEHDDRLIAVGYVHEETENGFSIVGDQEPIFDVAAWYSDDGISWFRATGSALEPLPRTQMMYAVASGPNEAVAIGFDNSQGREDGAVWRTLDGENWERVATGSEYALMFDLIWSGERWVAVGWDPRSGGRAWTSPDGIEWAIADVESSPNADLYALTVADSGLISIGEISTGSQRYGAIWHSTDGSSWDLVPTAGMLDDTVLWGVTSRPGGGLIAFGTNETFVTEDPTGRSGWDVGTERSCMATGDGIAWIGDLGITAGHAPCVTQDGGETWIETPDIDDLYAADVAPWQQGLIAVGVDAEFLSSFHWNGSPRVTGNATVGAIWIGRPR
jgi:hypothetical protein